MCYTYFSCHSDQTPDKKQLKRKRKVLFWLMVGWGVIRQAGKVTSEYWKCGPGTCHAMPPNNSSGFPLPVSRLEPQLMGCCRVQSAWASSSLTNLCKCVSPGTLRPVELTLKIKCLSVSFNRWVEKQNVFLCSVILFVWIWKCTNKQRSSYLGPHVAQFHLGRHP